MSDVECKGHGCWIRQTSGLMSVMHLTSLDKCLPLQIPVNSYIVMEWITLFLGLLWIVNKIAYKNTITSKCESQTQEFGYKHEQK